MTITNKNADTCINVSDIEDKDKMCECGRFPFCDAPRCPLDLEANERVYWQGEDICPFCLKKKGKSQKGIKTLMPTHLLEFVLGLNLKMLNRRNQRRWQSIANERSS